jgi:hypothetical protein
MSVDQDRLDQFVADFATAEVVAKRLQKRIDEGNDDLAIITDLEELRHKLVDISISFQEAILSFVTIDQLASDTLQMPSPLAKMARRKRSPR